MEEIDNNQGITRRGALCALSLVGVGILTSPASAEAATGVKVLASGKVQVTLKSNPALSKVGGLIRIDDVKGKSIALVRTSAKVYTAVNLLCTHFGGQLLQTGNQWQCQEHGATFTLAGKNLVGPATSPLKQLPVKVTATVVTIG
ncbi:MAG: ubiquinol-cytochrome c reductase iron-sulfur subunit [Candidatus Planktophila sp.]